jgi:hypothetical protein
MKKTLLIVAATLLFSSAAHAQCANCDADFNKAERQKAEQQAKEQKDKADKQQLRDSLGNGMAGKAADAAKEHNDKNEKALEDVDNPK